MTSREARLLRDSAVALKGHERTLTLMLAQALERLHSLEAFVLPMQAMVQAEHERQLAAAAAPAKPLDVSGTVTPIKRRPKKDEP